jgi:hypothetical protein
MLKKLRSRRTRLTLFSRVKRLLALAALLLALVLSDTFLPPSRVAATATCPESMVVWYFYTDDTYQVEAGQRHEWCDGRVTGHGEITLYHMTETIWECCNCSRC